MKKAILFMGITVVALGSVGSVLLIGYTLFRTLPG